MASKAQVEKAIFEREGFRVELELFEDKRRALPAYDYDVMAPHRWKVSDWKNARLVEYVLLVKGVTIYRGDGTPIPATFNSATCATRITRPPTAR